MKLKLKSFTLVEVLLVSSLIAVVGIAVFHSFGNGLKLWAKATRLNRQAEVAICFDKMGEDLRSFAGVSGINFKGTSSQISFAAVVMTRADSKSSRAFEGLINQIGAVRYRFDPAEHTILRRQVNYAQAIKDSWSSQELPVAEGITEMDFHYQVASDKGFLLKEAIDGMIPSGVMVEIHFSDDSGEHQLKRYLPIPIGV